MPPRYIAVPFVSGGGAPIPIPNPTISATTISSSEIDITVTYVGPPAVLGYIFEVAANVNGPFSPLASQTSNLFKDIGLLSSTTYYFRGRVQVSDGRFSNYTSVVSKTTLAAPPAQVTGVVAAATGTTTTHITWSSVVQASSYNVYRNDVLIANVITLLYDDSGLSASTFYTYNISAVNSAGEGPQSVDVSCTTNAQPVSGTRYKWHPGHYSSSDGRFGLNTLPSSGYLHDIDMSMQNQPWIVGHRQFVTWAALDMGPMTFTGSVGGATSGTLTTTPVKGNDTYFFRFSNGNTRSVTVSGTACTWTGALSSGSITTADVYRFSQMDILLARVASYGGYWGPSLLAMTFQGGFRNGDLSTVPAYIINSSVYGPCPNVVDINGTQQTGNGWWGGEYSDGAGAYSAATYRPAVANRYGLLGRAFGEYYDGNPNYELLCDQEDSAVAGVAVARQTFGNLAWNSNDPTYSDSQYFTSMKTYLQMWRDYHPHTSIVVQNTFMQGPTVTQQLATWMIANGYDVGSADTIGQSYYDTHPTAQIGGNYGVAAYAGSKDPGNTSSETYPDMRGKAACSLDVEGPDIGNGSGAKRPNKPLDICVALNQTYKANRAFWSVIAEGTGGYTWTNDITPVLKVNPLTTTAYPQNYPQ